MNANNQSDEFTLWFNMDYVEDTLSQITVSVSSEFMWIQMNSKKYVQRLEDKINELTGQQISITHIVKNKQTVSVPKKEPLPEPETKPTITEPEIIHQVEKKSGPTENSHKKHPQLNENFTFETFVPGENSIYAYNASISAAKNPGKAYNPILIYGGVGLGKTHLMQALGNFIYSNNEKSKIAYTSAENFTNEFTASLKNQTIDNFKKKYRSLDVLLLDDIHFLSGKEATQEELFYTFNALSDKNAQMVFTCDRPIREIQKMANRLVSRLSNGLSIDLQPPNYETRIAILQKKLQLKEKELNPEIIEFIAKNVETNVRELEAALNKVLGYIELFGGSPDLDTVKNQLKDLITANSIENISIDIIQKVIADNYQVSVSDLKSKKRDKKFVIPRQIAIYIAREITEISFMELGNEFGGKDHTTMMHAYEKVKDLIKIDPSLNNKIQLYIREIKEHK